MDLRRLAMKRRLTVGRVWFEILPLNGMRFMGSSVYHAGTMGTLMRSSTGK